MFDLRNDQYQKTDPSAKQKPGNFTKPGLQRAPGKAASACWWDYGPFKRPTKVAGLMPAVSPARNRTVSSETKDLGLDGLFTIARGSGGRQARPSWIFGQALLQWGRARISSTDRLERTFERRRD